MTDYTKNKAKLKPSQVFPELIPHLAKISKLNYELYELLKPSEIGRVLGISKQGFQVHIDKEKKNGK